MNPDQLMAFRAVALAGSISKAALRLHSSPSSLSRTVKSLESELGVELFDRHGRHLSLNQYGKVALHHSGVINEELANAVEDIRAAETREGKVLRIYFRNSLGNTGAALSSFIRMHQDDQLDIVLSKAEAQTEGFDLEFTSTIYEIVPDETNFLLATEGYCIAVSPDHWCAGRDEVSLSELKAEPFVIPPGDGGAFVLGICRKVGFKPRETIVCPQVWNAIRVVMQGRGVLIAPELSMLAGFSDEIARIPLKDDLGIRYLEIRLREGFALNDLAKELIDYLGGYFENAKRLYFQ